MCEQKDILIKLKLGVISLVYDGNIFLLEHADGEALEISGLELDKIMHDYYKDNF